MNATLIAKKPEYLKFADAQCNVEQQRIPLSPLDIQQMRFAGKPEAEIREAEWLGLLIATHYEWTGRYTAPPEHAFTALNLTGTLFEDVITIDGSQMQATWVVLSASADENGAILKTTICGEPVAVTRSPE